MIINTIEGLKHYLGRAINSATTLAFIQPYIQQAQDEFILPAIGPDMLTELDTQFNSTTPNTLTPVNKGLLTMVQKALAWYTYQKYQPFSLGTDGDNGMQEQGTDNTKSVRMGVVDLRRRETMENAAKALEAVLMHLYTFPNLYPTWYNSLTYTTTRSMFIANGTELGKAVPQTGGSYRLFVTLKPYLSRIERNSIQPILGQALFTALKTALVGTPPISGDMHLLLERVRDATAARAYAEALYNLNVVQMPGGQLRMLSDFDGIYNQKALTGHELDNAQRKADGAADASLNALKEFLTTYADNYPLYKNSDRFTAPGPNPFPDNKQYNGVFRMR
jgi:hypothetical protein